MKNNDDMVKSNVKHFISQVYKFSIPDKYFDEIKSKLVYEESLQGNTTRYINEVLVLHLKDKISISHLKKYTKSDTIWRKSIPTYLEEAERSYAKGHSAAGIFFCRLAIETALRDRIIKRQARLNKQINLSQEEKRLSEQTLNSLLQEACGKKLAILDSKDIDKIFSKLERRNTSFCTGKENVLNKFMHGDFLWLKDFLEKDKKITITHEEKTTKEFVASPNNISSFLFIEILEATYKTLLSLYPE